MMVGNKFKINKFKAGISVTGRKLENSLYNRIKGFNGIIKPRVDMAVNKKACTPLPNKDIDLEKQML
ncbi:hypothetical protein AB2G44_09970 [Escherichia coli]